MVHTREFKITSKGLTVGTLYEITCNVIQRIPEAIKPNLVKRIIKVKSVSSYHPTNLEASEGCYSSVSPEKIQSARLTENTCGGVQSR